MASTQETFTSIIKSDRVGRTRYSQAYKDEVVAAFQQSGTLHSLSGVKSDPDGTPI